MLTNNRRGVLTSLIGSAMICQIACEQEPRPSSTATFLNNDEVKDAVRVLSGAVENLESKVGAFDSENWRDVVTEVRSASTDVTNALYSLRKALGYPSN